MFFPIFPLGMLSTDCHKTRQESFEPSPPAQRVWSKEIHPDLQLGALYNHYILGLPLTQDASHHQDYYIFSRESQPKPSFATGILGGG